MMQTLPIPRSIFLADDDADDRMLFHEAMTAVSAEFSLTTANDGEQLMNILETKVPPEPQIIFLDMNMPLKDGMECLTDIKRDPKFNKIPIVIFSTSCEKESIDRMYESGADYYICKPDNFQKLKTVLKQMFTMSSEGFGVRPSRKDFLITV